MTHCASVYVDSALTMTRWLGHTDLHGRLLWLEKRWGQRVRGEGEGWEEEKAAGMERLRYELGGGCLV